MAQRLRNSTAVGVARRARIGRVRAEIPSVNRASYCRQNGREGSMFNSGNEFEYEVNHQRGEDDCEFERKKMYRRGRSSYRPTRRRSRKSSASHPGFGIAGRRNRRWNW